MQRTKTEETKHIRIGWRSEDGKYGSDILVNLDSAEEDFAIMMKMAKKILK
jgi:hypothetical protein